MSYLFCFRVYSFKSEDGIQGFVDPQTVRLGQGEEKIINIKLLKIPKKPVGSMLNFAVTVINNNNNNKNNSSSIPYVIFLI